MSHLNRKVAVITGSGMDVASRRDLNRKERLADTIGVCPPSNNSSETMRRSEAVAVFAAETPS